MSNLVFSYTRAQAIADGVLVDVTSAAKEAGFTIPVAVTDHVWARCVAVDKAKHPCQDEAGRLWDVLSVLGFHARTAKAQGVRTDRLYFHVAVKGTGVVKLYAVVDGGDDGSPVMTVMLEGED